LSAQSDLRRGENRTQKPLRNLQNEQQTELTSKSRRASINMLGSGH
jgi:hypothetical protein